MSDRTKQVQFRMPDELHTELKAALAYDRSSFADFFNKAADQLAWVGAMNCIRSAAEEIVLNELICC